MLQLSNISKSYGDQQILNQAALILNDGQRIGLVGANGVGKSTLLKIIMRQIVADSQSISVSAGARVGYLAQTIEYKEGQTIQILIKEALQHLTTLENRMRELETCMAEQASDLESIMQEYGEISDRFERYGGYEMDYRIKILLSGLKIDHLSPERYVVTLSGGEKARLGLAMLLLQNPDVLLLDEPTNHLDFASLGWLEDYLQAYRGSVLIVSHDREFLNRTVTAIVEIDEHSRKTKPYTGNYDAYLQTKTIERRQWEDEYANQQEEIKELRRAVKVQARQVAHNRPPTDGDKFLKHFKRGMVDKAISSRVASAEERLRRIEADPIPRPPKDLQFEADFDPEAIQGRTPLFVSGLSKSYGERRILDGISFTRGPRSRIVLIGPNGAGKSTVLKILAGLETYDTGEVYISPQVKIGYLDQQQEHMDVNQTVLDVYKEGLAGEDQVHITELLGSGLFRYDEISRQVCQLSSGQKRKLQIARLMAKRANMLMLDEPTNFVSFDVLESFEEALRKFPGPVLAVSHDRRFLKQFQGELWELRDGRIIQHSGAYEPSAVPPAPL